LLSYGLPVIIDPASPEHPYVQLAAQLRSRIEAGEITSTLPSIMNLTEETGLAVGTVRRAIRVLIDEGLAYTVPGRGTFVRPPGSRTPRQP
jgi:DNA-binding GntR family transcriptional regulator